MSVSIINITNASETGAFKFSVTLDGTDFQFDFRYNSREDSWYFDLYDVSGNIIRAGIKCVINFPLIRLIRESNRPLGELFCFDTRQISGLPNINDLGVNVFFGYVDQDQV